MRVWKVTAPLFHGYNPLQFIKLVMVRKKHRLENTSTARLVFTFDPGIWMLLSDPNVVGTLRISLNLDRNVSDHEAEISFFRSLNKLETTNVPLAVAVSVI